MTIRAFAIASLLLLAACQCRTPQYRVIDYLALYYAAEGRNQLMVEAVLERGAPVDAPEANSAGLLSAQAVNFDSPLQVAARNGDLEIVRLLLKHRPRIDHRCCDGPAALGYAAEAGHSEIVKELLDAGADPSIVSNYDRDLQGTPLDAARRRGHTAIVELLEHANNGNR